MKYVRRTTKKITEDFINNLLIDRGVLKKDSDFYDKFFNPTIENELPSSLLDNINSAVELFLSHLEKGNKIFLPIDPDVDGLTSSAVFYNYCQNHLKQLYPNFTIEYHIPEGKEHGLKTLMPLLENEKKYDLIMCIDSSSNDYLEHKTLSNIGYDIIVCDHHLCEKYSENAIVVNNQLSEQYENKALSGVGVIYKFFEYLEKKLELPRYSQNYLDLVALGVLSDVMVMTTLENRWICDYGLSHINNKFFKEIVEKQSYSLGDGPLTQIGVAFYITPLINALIRVGSQTEKERLFEAFINPEKIVPSTKRGEKGKTETICTQAIRNCVNAKAKQNREKDKAVELLEMQIIENCLDENKILILNADELNVSNTLTGLIAMGVAAKYKKPVLLGRTNSEGFFKGSGRGQNESELKDFRQFLLDSGLMDFAEGHSQAFGHALKVSNIDKLIAYANEKLKNIDFNEGVYEVDFIEKGNCSYLSELIEEIDNNKKLWGQGNSEVLIAIEDITINKNEISIIGQNKDTLRFNFNGITYVKFKADALIKELNNYSGKLNITVVGRGNINEWGGKRTPQVLIDDIEIKESSNYDF